MSEKTVFSEKTKSLIQKYLESSIEFSKSHMNEILSSIDFSLFEQTRNIMQEKFMNELFLFDNNQAQHLFLNLFQCAYPVKQMLIFNLSNGDNLEEILNENLYYAIILIIFKLVHPNNLPYLKDKIIENCLDFQEIMDMEMLIVNKLKWKIFLRTPIELISQLISDVSNLNFFNQNYLNNIFNTTVDMINYCFSDLTIYLNFDQFAISINCFFICLENYSEESLSNTLKSFLINSLKSFNIINNIHRCKLYLENKFLVNNNNSNNDELKNLTEDFNETKLDAYENKLTEYSLNNSKLSTLEYEKNKESINAQENFNKNYSTIDFDHEMNQKK